MSNSASIQARSAISVGPRHLRPYAWALTLVTALDYLDSSLFSFFASYIAGGINASPDEIVWSSSSYAVAAVLGILQQQWWVDRLGNKYYIAACMALYSVAGCFSALTETSMELMLARAAQGYFIGPMMGACRILLQDGGFPPEQRASGRRLFLRGIVAANALAPIAGGVLLSHSQWRALFIFTVPIGLILAALVLYAVPDFGKRAGSFESNEAIGKDLWPYLVFALSQGALQIFLQELHFQLFTSSAVLVCLLLTGTTGLAYFAHHQWNHPRPFVQLRGLTDRTFVVGLLLYGFYYYLTTAFSYLTLRFLEDGLSYPVENAGWLIGTTSLLSLALLTVYFRYSPRVVRKKWFIVPGFAVAALSGWIMMRFPPNANWESIILPLALRGTLAMFIAVPVANLTFRLFTLEEFSHSYRLKNIVRQLVVSFATSSIIIIERHRDALHYARLSESVNAYSSNFLNSVIQLEQVATTSGIRAPEAHAFAIGQLELLVKHQASFQAILDGFYFLAIIALCGGLFAIWQREID